VDFVSDVAIQMQLATNLSSLSDDVSCFIPFVNTEQELVSTAVLRIKLTMTVIG